MAICRAFAHTVTIASLLRPRNNACARDFRHSLWFARNASAHPGSAASRGLATRAQAASMNGETDGAGPFDYDLVTIGVGSGGTRASRMSASFGAKVLAVEMPFNPISSETEGGVGGTCVLRGCVPKKLLVYGSAFRAEFQDAAGFGWDVAPAPPLAFSTLMSGKTKEITRLNGVYKRILANAGVELAEARATLAGPHAVLLTPASGPSRTVTAKHILVAVGGTPSLPAIPGIEHAITSDHALALESLPSSIAIVGGGYIGCEFASIFAGLGCKVHLVIRQKLILGGFDAEVRAHLQAAMAARGVTFHPGLNPESITKAADGRLSLSLSGGAAPLAVDAVMFATGRNPKTRNLGLESVGVTLDSRGGIVVDSFSRSSVPSIWAVGDVTNRVALTPVALAEGMAFAKTAFKGIPSTVDYADIATAVFTQPPVGTVGLSEEQAVAAATGPIDVFVSTFTPMRNTLSGRAEKTLMKLVVDGLTDRVLGVHMVGPDAGEIIQGIAVAVKCGATKAQFDATVGVHPTAAEEFVTMRDRTRRVEHVPAAKATAPA